MPLFGRRFVAALLFLLFALPASRAFATTNPPFSNGWYWDSTLSGMGVSLEIHNDTTMFVAVYTYTDIDPFPSTWYAGLLTYSAASSTFTGSLSQYSRGQTLTGAFQTPTATSAFSSVTLRITGTDTGFLAFGQGSILNLQRFPFGALAAPASGMPTAGWWWNSAESGRGWYVEVQGSQIYMAGFMYRTDGSPVWYVTTGAVLSGAAPTYSGSLQICAGGPSLTSGPVDATSVQCSTSPGTISISFTSSSTATLTLPSGAQEQLTRFSF